MVAEVPHKSDPVKLLAVSTELPQLFTTDTFGTVGFDLGAGVALVAELEQPPTFCVSVTTFELPTVILGVDSLELQIKVPV